MKALKLTVDLEHYEYLTAQTRNRVTWSLNLDVYHQPDGEETRSFATEPARTAKQHSMGAGEYPTCLAVHRP
jgi:hypothetical protein